ncbi:hypothetical protein [Parabacteroides goldsteinii]|uniref:hypothetical protein n=1 Tax=Parabacteroides goldsteinii TaxID=328812 RepID=UPI0026762C64|nr:hypothetical protein [Parabacteroides goldsteinii]
MNEEKDYQTKLLEAILQTSMENKAIGLQNNLLLNEILSKLNNPGNDVKAMLIDIVSNLAAYNIVNKQNTNTQT